jgi:DNA-binding NarL/FixJ family response regulator
MEAISMGCVGYLAPPIQIGDLMEAIRLCNEGLIWAPRRVLSKLIHNLRAQRNDLDRFDKIQPKITPREEDVLRFLIKGWTNKEIAQALGVDEITVKVHISHLLKKLDLKNRCQIISHLIYHHWEG